MNWAPFVLGIVIVGLETGWFYAYKAGYKIKCYGEIRNNMSVIKKRRRTITVENVKLSR